MMASSTSETASSSFRRHCSARACSPFGNFLNPDRLPLRRFVEIQGLHLDQVDDPGKAVGVRGRSCPDRNLQRHRVRPQPADNLVERPLKVGPDPIHLVDEADARNAVLVGLPPDGFALGFDPLHGAENDQRPVQHPQAPLDLGRKIDVPRRVDDVDRVLGDAGRLVLPAAGNGGRVDRDPALRLFRVEVGDRRAVVDFAHLVGKAGVVEDPLGRRGLAGIDMSHDADIADSLGHHAKWANALLASAMRCTFSRFVMAAPSRR